MDSSLKIVTVSARIRNVSLPVELIFLRTNFVPWRIAEDDVETGSFRVQQYFRKLELPMEKAFSCADL